MGAKSALYRKRQFERKWLCDNHCSPMRSGKRSSHCFLKLNVVSGDDRQRTTASCWKEFFGSSRRALAGATSPVTSVSVAASVGNDCIVGTSKECGSEFGECFSRNWTEAGDWIGRRVSWTGVSLLPKRGRRNWQNQAWKGHKVDGGGRRPRYSSGKPFDERFAQRSALGRADAGRGFGAAQWSWPAAKATAATYCRPWLRQRPIALAPHRPRYSLNQSSPQKSSSGSAQRWPVRAPIPETMENRTNLRMAGQLSSIGGSIRPKPEYVSRIFPHRLRVDHLAFPAQMNLETASSERVNSGNK